MQVVRKTISMTDRKFLHHVTLMKVNAAFALISLQHHGTMSHTTTVNCFQKCAFNLNSTNDGKDAREFSIAKVS
jgi:hypothetical protein